VNRKQSPFTFARGPGSFRAMRPGNCGNLGNIGNSKSLTCRLDYRGDDSNPPPLRSFILCKMQRIQGFPRQYARRFCGVAHHPCRMHLLPAGVRRYVDSGRLWVIPQNCEFSAFAKPSMPDPVTSLRVCRLPCLLPSSGSSIPNVRAQSSSIRRDRQVQNAGQFPSVFCTRKNRSNAARRVAT
jgi:hypothetical protein